MQHFLNSSCIVSSLNNFKGNTLTTPESCSAIPKAVNRHVLDFIHFEIFAQFSDHFHDFLYWIERITIFRCFVLFLLFFLNDIMITNLRGSRYFRVSLYSLFSTILSKFRIMSCFALFWLRFFFC